MIPVDIDNFIIKHIRSNYYNLSIHTCVETVIITKLITFFPKEIYNMTNVNYIVITTRGMPIISRKINNLKISILKIKETSTFGEVKYYCNIDNNDVYNIYTNFYKRYSRHKNLIYNLSFSTL